VKATKTRGGLNTSPSYNPARNCNISSFILNVTDRVDGLSVPKHLRQILRTYSVQIRIVFTV